MKKSGTIISWLFLAAGFIFSLIYISHNYMQFINSDMSSELLLGKKLSLEGGLLSEDWYYSSELRVLNTQIIYKLFLKLFPDNWLLVRIGSSALLFIIMVAAYMFMAYSIGLRDMGIRSACILVWPFGFWWAQNIILGLYYIPHISITFSAFLICSFASRLFNSFKPSESVSLLTSRTFPI